MDLHKESIKAVLPDPTGPPMPTRSGPLGLCMMRSFDLAAEQAGILGFVPDARQIGAEGRAAEIIKLGGQSALRRRVNGRFERLQQALAVGMAEWDQPHAGGYPVRHHSGQESVQRGAEW